MAKTAEIKVLVSPERKQLWKEYCEAFQHGLTLSRLVEQAIDDKVCNRTEYKCNQAGVGWYWTIKPNGNNRKQYDAEVLSEGRKEIERLSKQNKECSKETEGF